MGWCGQDAMAYEKKKISKKDIRKRPKKDLRHFFSCAAVWPHTATQTAVAAGADCLSPTCRHGIVRYRPKSNTGACGRVGNPNLRPAGWVKGRRCRIEGHPDTPPAELTRHTDMSG